MLRFGRRPALLLSAIAALVLALPVATDAAAGERQGAPKVTVMTRNVFLGGDLGPALPPAATTLDEAIDGAGVILNEVDETNFPERAKPLAKEIAQSEPDLVGLQEVALWRQQIPADGPPEVPPGIPAGTEATDVRYDFLALLLQELEAIDAHYKVVEVQTEFDQELPVDLDGSNATGNLLLFGAELDARLTMRDVILAKMGSSVRPTGETDGAHFTNLLPLSIGGAIPIFVERGWVSTEATIGGTSTEFRFVNTHLEAFHPGIRLLQAQELIAVDGPLDTDKQVILAGDLNSGTEARHNIQDPRDWPPFQALLGFGMTDNGAIQSCCYSDLFDPTQVFDHTVDHVLTKPPLATTTPLETTNAFITGNDPTERTPSGLWPSDHGGVVSTLELKK
jgi:endonuclease/exonuclease/phosphatase family metal-dependent hydrolase